MTTDQTADSFFNILEYLDAIVFVVDMQTNKVLYANKYTENLFGKVSGKMCWQALQSGMSGPCAFCSKIDLCVADEKPLGTIAYEVRNIFTGRWYDVHERDVELPDGKIVRIHFATDITDKKKIDSEFSKREDKYRTVADYAYDWEYWINEERQFKYISPSCERITGYRVDEFLSDPDLLYDIIHPEDRPVFIRHREQAFTSDQYSSLDFRIITKTGEERWISHYCRAVYSKDGEFRGRRSSNRDITDRKEAERKTKLNERRLTTLVQLYEKKELPAQAICDFVLESSLPITSSSIGFMGFLNDSESVMTILAWSKSVMQECAVHQKPIEFTIAEAGIWGEAVRKRQPVVINNFSLPSSLKRGTPEGHIEIKRFMAVPLVFENRVVAVLAVGNKGRDYNNDDIDQVSLLLEGMWQIMLRKKAEDDLVKQSEKVKHFTNAVAHDLKSPAITIHGFARKLKEKYGDVMDEKGLKYCDQIIKSSEQIFSLVEDINTYIATRENVCEFESLELTELWNTIRQEFLLQLQGSNINWHEPHVESVEIRCNKMGLLRIFRNLIDNALKHGGDNLTEIVLGYELSNDYHILTVENNGEIILPEDKKIIFKEFARKVKKPQIYGSGLGLSIVRQIAKKHKGTSWLTTSDRGKPVFCISISRYLQ